MNYRPVILYVEDYPAVREELSLFLKYFSRELYIAEDGEIGLELFKQHLPDIIVSDIKMPNMNGIEMVTIIKEINPEQHIIFTTAHNESGYFMDAIEAQVDGYILKPVNLKKLEQKLNSIIKKIGNEIELKRQYEITEEISQLQDDLLIVTDSNKVPIYANKIFLDFFNIASLDIFNKTYDDIASIFVKEEGFFYPEDKKKCMEELLNLSSDKRVVSILNKDSETNFFIISIKQIPITSHTIITFTEITEIAREKNKYKYKAYTDELTGLYNRAYYNIEIKKEIARCQREQQPLSYILFDIDHFKQINDDYGHQIGDTVLVELAKIINTNTRVTDTFVRWGGEEFVQILPNTMIENAVNVAEYLRELIQSCIFINDIRLTCSFGVAEFSKDDNQNNLIQKADDALYRAKKNGRNRIES